MGCSGSVEDLDDPEARQPSSNSSPHPPQQSDQTSTVPTGPAECRICRESGGDLIRNFCNCTGTVGYAHISCLQQFLSTESSHGNVCELCVQPYRLTTRALPCHQRNKLQLDSHQRTKFWINVGTAVLAVVFATVSAIVLLSALFSGAWEAAIFVGALLGVWVAILVMHTVYFCQIMSMWKFQNLSLIVKSQDQYVFPEDVRRSGMADLPAESAA